MMLGNEPPNLACLREKQDWPAKTPKDVLPRRPSQNDRMQTQLAKPSFPSHEQFYADAA
jgi:hypothetical protein